MSLGYNVSLKELFENDTKTTTEKYEEFKSYIFRKGYGDRIQELSLFKNFFEYFFLTQKVVFEIEWHQYQDYNDNWLYFDIQNLKVNQYLEISVFELNDSIEEIWDYSFDKFTEENVSDWAKWYEKLNKETQEIRQEIDKIIVFLKALYDSYGAYYLIYLFGRRARVKITKEGIEIDNENIDYLSGDEFDKIINIDNKV